MKIKGIILLVGMYIMLLTACVDYQAIIDQQMEIETTNEEIPTSLLGDINNDGKTEKIDTKGSVIRLLSGTKILKEFEPNPSIKYLYATGGVIDMDNDDVNEIVVFAATDNDAAAIVFVSLYVIDVNNEGEYYLREFPTELATIYSTSGIEADICVKGKFLYEIKCKDKEFIIDVSRLYGLSTISIEDKEKLEKKWEDIISNNYKGEVVGIVKSEIITESDGQRYLRGYELVRGADGLDIGYIIFKVSFDKNGAYVIEDISFMERTDVQP